MSLITDAIKNHRREFGLSQADLGELLGISQSHIGRLEAGAEVPTLPTLQRLAKFFRFTAIQVGSYALSVEATRCGTKSEDKPVVIPRRPKPLAA